MRTEMTSIIQHFRLNNQFRVCGQSIKGTIVDIDIPQVLPD